VVKGEKYTGCKKEKETQCYCVGIWWEKWKSLSKAVKPGCFKNPIINIVPLIWKNNKKSLDYCSYNGRAIKHV
jgi:hypothetical protein